MIPVNDDGIQWPDFDDDSEFTELLEKERELQSKFEEQLRDMEDQGLREEAWRELQSTMREFQSTRTELLRKAFPSTKDRVKVVFLKAHFPCHPAHYRRLAVAAECGGQRFDRLDCPGVQGTVAGRGRAGGARRDDGPDADLGALALIPSPLDLLPDREVEYPPL